MKFQWLVLATSLSLGLIWLTVQFSYGRFAGNIQESFPGAPLAMLMSVIGLNVFILLGLSPIALFVVRLLKYKNTLLVGAGIWTVGICLVSMAMNEYQFLVGYGTYALGGLFIYNNCTFMIGHVFPQKSRYHVFATSMAKVTPIAFITVYFSNRLILVYGWRITYIIFGAVFLVIIMVSTYIYGLQEELDLKAATEENHHLIFDLVPEESEGSFFKWIEKSKLKRISLMLSFMLATSSKAMFVNCLAYLLVKHGITLGFSETDSSMLVLYVGLSELLSRLLTSLIGDHFLRGNFVKMYIVLLLMGSAVQFGLGYMARSYNELVIYALAVGFVLGPLVAGSYAMCGEIAPVQFIDDLYAYYNTCYGIGIIVGLVTDGYIYDVTGSFYGVFIMNGCLHIFSAVMYGVLRLD